MKQHALSSALLTLPLLFLGNTLSNAATLSLDLDIHTPGIQNSLTLNLGRDYEVGVVFTGDGTTQFDTFALDLVHDTPAVGVHSPAAGAIVDSAPLMAFDIYGATQVSSGDSLTRGSMPTPLGFAGGLGGVGVSSLGGMPFPLLAQDETVGLFNASLSALHGGSSTLALTGYPFGIGAGLSLAGAHVPVTLEGASFTVVPVPPALWLFASGVLALLGVGRHKAVRVAPYKILPHLSLLFALALLSPLSFAVPQDADADLNGDAMVTSQDISILARCFGQDPKKSTSDCAKADVDKDGDIDGDDFSFVSARLGQTYPETLFQEPPIPPLFPVGDNPSGSALGDVNGDGVVDVVTANGGSDDISVLLGNGDGSFQAQQRFAAGDWPNSIALGDLSGDGVLDVVTANTNSNDISVLLGNGDGSFQTQQRFTAGDEPTSVTLGDLNGDGVLDVVTANFASSDISVLLGNGDGSFQAQQRFAVDEYPNSIALGDLNGDGVLDVVTASELESSITVLIGNGDGTFQAEPWIGGGYSPRSVTLGDLNGDGALDAVTTNGWNYNMSVRLGNGDGSFQTEEWFPAGSAPGSITLGDLNGDGVLDAVVGNYVHGGGNLSVLIGDGDGGFQAHQRFATGVYRGSLTLGDVNSDGVLDVVTPSGNNILLLLGNGDGSFQAQHSFAVGDYPEDIALGDVNGDGMLDVLTANRYSDDISVLLGNGDGGFHMEQRFAVDSGYEPDLIALGDLNGDGALDAVTRIVLVGHNSNISVLLGNGDGTFEAEPWFGAGYWPRSVTLGDLNGDGALDVVTRNYNSDDISVLLGNGDGSFQAPQHFFAGEGLSPLTLGDVNGDGVLDAVAVNSNGNFSVLIGSGDGSFQTPQHFFAGEGLSRITLGDVNNDGALDVVTRIRISGSHDILVWLGNGDGSFQVLQRFTTGNYLGLLTLGDVNGDGVLDLVATAYLNYSNDSSAISVLLGNGDGSFQAQQRFAVGEDPYSIALGDLNNDGVLDVATVNNGSFDVSVLLSNGD